MRIVYQVNAEPSPDHRVKFTLELAEVDAPSVDLVLPSWVPGSYHIIDYVRKVRTLRASAAGGGRPLPVDRVDKARWRITTNGASELEVHFEVYGHELVTEALDATPDHLFLNAALCLPYVDGKKELPHDVVFHLPTGWKVYTELAQVAQHPPRFRAATYDELVDSPIDCGVPEVLSFTAKGIPHQVVLCGRGGNHEPHRLESDLAKMVTAAIDLFGDSPLTHYTFFLHLHDVSDGALEHASSYSAVLPRWSFRPTKVYQRFLRVAAHEYFHLYNVKRIRPKVLGPFDYTREVYTRLLWVMEGTTDFYGPLILRRSGLLSPAEYLDQVATSVQKYLATPGRLVTSLEDSSFLAWVGLYQAYEESVNQSVSYYLKGELVSWCLDLEIRHRTENRSSLDDVYRHLWTEYGKRGRGLAEDEFRAVVEQVTKLDLSEFFRRYVSGTDEVDLAAFARYAGLKLAPKPKGPEAAEEPEPGYLGVTFRREGDLVRLTSVLDGGPGRKAGLSPGDEIVALDGVKVTYDGFTEALGKLPPGSDVTIALFRRGYLTEVRAATGAPPPEKYAFTPLEDATPLAKRIYESWVGAPWEPAKKEPAPN